MDGTKHEANDWIEEQWLGKPAMQVRVFDMPGTKGLPDLRGKCGTVREVFWDEKGALHCLVAAHDMEWWAPASLLTTDFREPTHCQAVSVDGEQCVLRPDHDAETPHRSDRTVWAGDHYDQRCLLHPSERRVVVPAPVVS